MEKYTHVESCYIEPLHIHTSKSIFQTLTLFPDIAAASYFPEKHRQCEAREISVIGYIYIYIRYERKIIRFLRTIEKVGVMKISFSFSLLFPPPIQLRSSLSISLALSFFFLLLFILALPICHFKKYPSRGIQTNHTLTMPLVLGAYISPTRPHGTLTESNNTLGSQPCA